MTMLPITIDELRADYGPSSIPTPSQQRAQFLAMRQSLQQFTVETGKGPYVEPLPSLVAELEGDRTVLRAQVDRQADTIKRLQAQVDVLRAQNRSLTDRCLGLEGKRPAPGGALDDAPGAGFDMGAIKLSPAAPINPVPISIMTGAPGAGFDMTSHLSSLPAASPLLVDKATGEIRHVSILTGLPIGPRVPRRESA